MDAQVMVVVPAVPYSTSLAARRLELELCTDIEDVAAYARVSDV